MSKMIIVRLKIMLRLSFLKISGVVYSVKLINKSLHNNFFFHFHYQKLLTTWLKLISSFLKISFSTFKTMFLQCIDSVNKQYEIYDLVINIHLEKNAPNCIHDKWKWISYLFQYRICSQWVQSISEVLVQISQPAMLFLSLCVSRVLK